MTQYTSGDFKQQMKKYAFYFLSFTIIAVLILLIALFSNLGKSNNNPLVEQASANAITFTSPVLNAQILKNYSSTELQWNESLNQWETHKAIDFLAENGSNVYAVFEGSVASITTDSLKGTQITLEHSNGLKTVYSMLNKETNVEVGDSVESGTQLGTVAQPTGVEEQDGAHLHFEVWKDGSKIDPGAYLDIENK